MNFESQVLHTKFELVILTGDDSRWVVRRVAYYLMLKEMLSGRRFGRIKSSIKKNNLRLLRLKARAPREHFERRRFRKRDYGVADCLADNALLWFFWSTDTSPRLIHQVDTSSWYIKRRRVHYGSIVRQSDCCSSRRSEECHRTVWCTSWYSRLFIECTSHESEREREAYK